MAAGNLVVLTPGNHDFGIPGLPGNDHVAALFPAIDTARRRFRHHLLEPVIQQKGVVAHRGFDIIIRHGKDVFVALRSTHHGRKEALGLLGVSRIRREQIEWALEVSKPLRRERELRFHFVDSCTEVLREALGA